MKPNESKNKLDPKMVDKHYRELIGKIFNEWSTLTKEIFSDLDKGLEFRKELINITKYPDFSERVKKAENYIDIYSGALNCNVYNNKNLNDAFEEALLKRKTKIFIHFGNEVAVDDKNNNYFYQNFLRKNISNTNLEARVYSKSVKIRPEFHGFISNNILSFEYPHYEFEDLRIRISFENKKIVEKYKNQIKEYYVRNSTKLNEDNIGKLILFSPLSKHKDQFLLS